MDERTRRIGENEALFRQVNETIERLNEPFAQMTETMVLVCECGDSNCIEHIGLTAAEYAALRRNAQRFAVKPGHEIADVEDVVERHDGYWVVEKHEGEPATLAEDL